MQWVKSADMVLMTTCWKKLLENQELGLPKTTFTDKLCRHKNELKTLGEFVLGALMLPATWIFWGKKKAAAGEVAKQWTREEFAPGTVVSGHGPTHFAAEELGNHGNAHTDARNISSFAWAKEGM